MSKKAKLDRLFLLIVPCIAFLALLVAALIAYNGAYGEEKDRTTEYFSMVSGVCSDRAEGLTATLRSQTAYAGSVVSTSKLATDTLTYGLGTVVSEAQADSAMVVANGVLVYGDNPALYDSFSEFAASVSAADTSPISDIVTCADGVKRFAVGSYTIMDYGARVTVLLVYPATRLAEIVDIPKMTTESSFNVLGSDGAFVTGSSAIDRPGDDKNLCTAQLLGKSKNKLTSYKEFTTHKKYFAYSGDLGVNGWRIFCAVPVSSVRSQLSRNVGIFVRIVIIALVVLFAAFLYYYYGANRSNRRQIIERRKFLIAAKQSSRAVFEYDTLQDKFFLINDCEKIALPGQMEYLTKAMGVSYIHPEDIEEVLRIFRELKKEPTSSATVRACYFCGENTYHWYYITATRLARKGMGSTVVIGIMEDIDEREKERIALLKKATTDGLTGLFNRAETTRLVADKLENQTPGCTSAFIIFDLDDFKGINDKNGHEIGDRVLKFFADKLKATFRTQDVVGRLGGDEFVVFMSFSASDDLVQRRFAAFAESISFRRSEDEDLPYISCSAGYVYANQTDSFESMYRRADKALYRAKTIGKNCAVCGD